tara:strand:+ start:48 stop:188 length:141 start_codon:yes stop_codon:yes gene_type:complete
LEGNKMAARKKPAPKRGKKGMAIVISVGAVPVKAMPKKKPAKRKKK